VEAVLVTVRRGPVAASGIAAGAKVDRHDIEAEADGLRRGWGCGGVFGCGCGEDGSA